MSAPYTAAARPAQPGPALALSRCPACAQPAPRQPRLTLDCSAADGREGIESVDNLPTLVHLHEAAILHSLCSRHAAKRIYTWCGPVLLATNPFERLPLYDQPTLLAYDRPTGPGGGRLVGGDDEAPLPPHIFAVANDSYRSMMASGDERTGDGRLDQSVLVSGESGAGKPFRAPTVSRAHPRAHAGPAPTTTSPHTLCSASLNIVVKPSRAP